MPSTTALHLAYADAEMVAPRCDRGAGVTSRPQRRPVKAVLEPTSPGVWKITNSRDAAYRRSNFGSVAFLGVWGLRQLEVGAMSGRKSLRLESEIQVKPITAAEQEYRVNEAIARRAYELFEGRGAASWHELDDWRRAEAEVHCTMCFGLTEAGDKILVGCDLNRFEEGSVEVWIAPKRITIGGKPLDRDASAACGCATAYAGPVFREIQLPTEINPKEVVIERKHRLLEIKLPFVQQEVEQLKKAHAV